MKGICGFSHAHRPIKQAFTGIVQPNVVWWGLKTEKSNYNVDRLYCALKLLFSIAYLNIVILGRADVHEQLKCDYPDIL